MNDAPGGAVLPLGLPVQTHSGRPTRARCGLLSLTAGGRIGARVDWDIDVRDAVGLSGSKISEDFGNRGLRGYAMLLITLTIYAAAIAIAFV